MITEDTKGQKRWDGEAGNGDWNEEKNWHPDGVPDSSALVIFDNTIITSSYSVKISSDTTTVKLNSLNIQPAGDLSIIVEIPKTNKATPALSLFSNKLSLVISKGGILINRSTAVAGNTILMNGKIRIEDGGIYSHQTLRGNAYIITKLETNSGTEKGIVEFDVPGTTTYPISLSGRQYGSIWLTSSSKEKRTFTGTGINDLMIRGDLIIDDSIELNSSLTGNIYLAGKLINKGSISFDPTKADSINRELVFIGDSSEYYSSGSLLFNEFSNGIRLKRGTLLLKSSLQLNMPSCSFTVDPHARLMMDTFFIYGIGHFKSNSRSVLGIASPDGISMIASKGNIRTTQKSIDTTTSFIFYGNQEQMTGTAFPSIISGLEINKNNGELRLSLPLVINDTLVLSKGVLQTSPSELLELRGIAYSKTINQYGWSCGNDSSFIDGPLRITSTTPDVTFPLGKESTFAPMNIKFGNTIKRTIEVEYVTTPKLSINDLLPPLRSLDKKGYWKLRRVDQADTIIHTATAQLGINSKQTNDLLNPPFMAIADTVTSTWTITEHSSFDQINNIVTGTIPLKELVLSLGSTQEEILTIKRVDLSYRKDDQAALLMWTILGEMNVKDMYIEKSVDGINYTRSNEHTQPESHIYRYQKKIILDTDLISYFRIVCKDETDKNIVSNTVCVRDERSIDLPYPNPAQHEIMIGISSNFEIKTPHIQVLDMNGRMIPVDVTINRNNLRINTSRLSRGLYRLIIPLGKENRIYPFIKN